MDAQAPFEEQDLRIADLVEREGRALVIGMNKWDLDREPRRRASSKLREEADHWLPQVKGVPVVALSGLTGEGLDRLMQAVVDAHAVWNRRVADQRAQPLARRGDCGASAAGGVGPAHPARLHDPAEERGRRPSCCSARRADAVPEAYRRYLVNGLREAFDLPGTPIRLTLREKANPYAGRKRR